MITNASKKKKAGKENSKSDTTRKSTRKTPSASKSPAKKGSSSGAATKAKEKPKKKKKKPATGTKKRIEDNNDDDPDQDEEEPPVETPSQDNSGDPEEVPGPESVRRIGWDDDSSGLQANGVRNGTSRRGGTVDPSNELERSSLANKTLRAMLERRQDGVSDYRNQLTKVQSESLAMKEQVRALKRAATEPAEGEEEVAKKKGKIVKEDHYKHAAMAGKKYTALYDAWGAKATIFEGFRAAALEAGEVQEEEEDSDSSDDDDNDDDNDSSSSKSSTDNEDGGLERRVAKGDDRAAGEGGEEITHPDFADPEAQEAYTRESAARFWREAKASEVKGWQKAEYKTRFMTAASRMRSAFRDNTEDPRIVFGFNIEAKDFGRSTRKALPEVAELLENTTFLPNPDDEQELAYRHPCLLQIARRILNGKAALLNGKKSPMAREVFATQWSIKRVTLHFIAIVAYMAFFILSGEETLSHAPNTIEVYWEHLDSLLRLEKGTSTFIKDLLNYWNFELGLKDATKKKPVNKGKNALLRAFGA